MREDELMNGATPEQQEIIRRVRNGEAVDTSELYQLTARQLLLLKDEITRKKGADAKLSIKERVIFKDWVPTDAELDKMSLEEIAELNEAYREKIKIIKKQTREFCEKRDIDYDSIKSASFYNQLRKQNRQLIQCYFDAAEKKWKKCNE